MIWLKNSIRSQFLYFAARWDRAFGFKIFIKVMNLMLHLSSIHEPYKFSISCPYKAVTLDVAELRDISLGGVHYDVKYDELNEVFTVFSNLLEM